MDGTGMNSTLYYYNTITIRLIFVSTSSAVLSEMMEWGKGEARFR